MKVDDLSGDDLDLWVGKALGYQIINIPTVGDNGDGYFYTPEPDGKLCLICRVDVFCPSQSWVDAGKVLELIAETHKTESYKRNGTYNVYCFNLSNQDELLDGESESQSFLEALMRVFVKTRFGGSVNEH